MSSYYTLEASLKINLDFVANNGLIIVFLRRKPHGTSPKEKGLRALFSITKMTQRMQAAKNFFALKLSLKPNKPFILPDEPHHLKSSQS